MLFQAKRLWAIGLVSVAAGTACKSDSAGPGGNFSLSISAGVLSIVQGQSGTVTATIARTGNFAGAVTIAVEGLPSNVTAAVNPTRIEGAGTTSTITINVASGAAPGNSTLTVRASGSGVDPKTATLTLTVTAAVPPGYTFALSPTALSIQQGGQGTSTATLTRTGGFAGSVAFSATGAPTDMTVAFDPSNTTANTTTITVAVGAAVAAGAYPITIRGTATALTDQTAVLTVTVTAPAAGNYAIALDPTALSIQQGAQGTSTATLTRTGGFAGSVAFSATGAPTGMTVTFNPTSTTGNTTTITVAVGAAVAAGAYPITIVGTATGLTDQTAVLNVTVTSAAAGNYTIALNPTALSIQQGAQGTSTATLTRTGGFAGSVAFSATGAPNGMAVTFNPTSTTGNTTTITVAVGAAVATGTYPVTIRGTATGLADQTIVLNVTVTSAGVGGNTTYRICTPTPAIFAAGQDGTGNWQALTITGGTVSFNVTSGRGGVAFVYQSGNSFVTTFFYGSQAELNNAGSFTCTPTVPGTKTLTGSVANVGASEIANVTVGSAATIVTPLAGNTFTLMNVTDGVTDLVAFRNTQTIAGTSFTQSMNRGIIRLGVNYTGTVPLLDFTAAESFAAQMRTLTVNGLGSDQIFFLSESFMTQRGVSGGLYLESGGGPGATREIPTVPNATTGQLHALTVGAGNATALRMINTWFQASADKTVTLGPPLGAVTVTEVAATPNRRFRAQYTVQPDYNRLFSINYNQTSGTDFRSILVTVTQEYQGSSTAFDHTIPDLTGLTGAQAAWWLQAGAVQWGFSAFGFTGTGVPADGTVFTLATRSGSN